MMKITIAGSLGNIGRPLTQQLVQAGHTVTVISSQSDRQAEIAALGAQAAIGSITDVAFLVNAFAGADAVYTMTPPNMGGSNIIENTVQAGRAFVQAIKETGIRRVVMLSSVGADLPAGNGPIAGLHHIEQLYNDLDGVVVTYVRAGYFYNNFYNDVPMIKNLNFMGGNYPATVAIPLVYPEDIATVIAEELQRTSTGKEVRYIVSDVRTPQDVAAAIGAAIEKPELHWVTFTDEQSMQGMLQAGLPEEIAGLYTEMGAGFASGQIPKDFREKGSPVTGKIKLADFAKEFASKF